MSFLVGWLFATALVAVFVARRSVHVVHEGEGGVVTSFGRVVSGLRPPGLHLKAPWHTVHAVPLREIQEPATYGGVGQILAWDGTPLRVEATIRYRVDPARAEHWLFGVEHAKDHMAELFEALLRGAVATFPPGSDDPTAFARLRRDRADLLALIDQRCRAELSELHGVQYRGMDVSAMSPPRELDEALNAVLEAEAVASQRRDEAAASCEQRAVAAREGLLIADARARAVELEMGTLADALRSLHREGTLQDYVGHRRSEVLALARTLYVRSEA